MKKIIVALVSFGMRSTEKISRSLHRLQVDHKIVLLTETPDFEYTHVILSGSNKRITKDDYYMMPDWILFTDQPVLGIAYGFELIIKTLGGYISDLQTIDKGASFMTEIIDNKHVTNLRWVNRADRIISLPINFFITGVNKHNQIIAGNDGTKWYGVQYHPEANKFKDISIFAKFLNDTNK